MAATIRVLMTATAKGALTSTHIKEFHEGQEYDIPEELAHAFFDMGVADPAEAHEKPQDGREGDAGSKGPADGETPATRKRRAGK